MDESPVRHGELLAGKYRVESVLGSGGMGVVVAAVHVELGQRVALKFVLPQALENPEVASRFLREARAAVKIDSEHVARVLDVGRLESGAPYMVMEYLEGTDLSAHAHGAELPIEEAVDFALQACAAMAVAHAAGIIHRDLKPANLFVTKRPDGSALLKVLDFGISKMSVMDAPASLTNTSAMMGSPLYMSPEQAQSARQVDGRTDIWSLGVILYELLTGVPPFPGQTLGEVLANLMTKTPQPPSALRAGIPPGLEQAVMRALEKSLERRYANIGELSAALVEFAPASSRMLHDRVSRVMSRAGMSSAPPPPSAVPATSAVPAGSAAPLPSITAPLVSATDMSWAQQEKIGKRSLFLPLALGGAAALLALAVGVFWLTREAPRAEVA
ncbi:MAG TPA: serine/threonine-protein kinase, partial [Polyangiaceae bacterium]|nr:serine/threonine-protein kinase [Polyangiaceae bacterium]